MLNENLQRFEYNTQQGCFHVSDMRESTPGPEHGWELIAEDISQDTYHSIVEFQNDNIHLFKNQSHPVHTVTGWIVNHLIANGIKDPNARFSFSNEMYQRHLKK